MKTKLASSILILGLLAGCGTFVPHETQSNQTLKEQIAINSTQQQAVTKQSENALPPIVQTGTNNSVTISSPPPRITTEVKNDFGQNTQGNSDLTEIAKSVIPVFVKLIGIAFGLALLAGVIFAVVWYARKNSLAANTAFSIADSALAAQIQKHSTSAIGSTDPAIIAQHASAIAELQTARVDLSNKTP